MAKKEETAEQREKDDLGRAFAGLKPSLFPDRHNPQARPAKKKVQPFLPSVPPDTEDEDAALFMQALGAVKGGEMQNGFAVMESLAPRLKAEKAKIKDKQEGGKSVSIPVSAAITKAQKANAPTPDSLTKTSTISSDEPQEEDAELLRLHKELQDVTPLRGKTRMPAPPPASASATLAYDPLSELQALVDGKLDFTFSGNDDCLEGHVVGLDLLTVAKLQARHYSPEGHIDLHGLNSQQAFGNLVAFVRDAYQRGKRTLLVVTGRGKGSPDGTPVLRGKVQEWFTQEPFRRVVLAFCSAKREDGGPGALYVLLRKHKKKQGKVRWDRLPSDPDLFIL